MAPTPPSSRLSSRRTTTSSSLKPKSSLKPTNPLSHTRPLHSSSFSTFSNSKSDKRTIKHSSFVSRIEKTSKKPLKRRRPSKKLVTTLDTLADALPNVEELVKQNESGKLGKGNVIGANGRKVEVKTLSSGKGFMKRRDKVEKGERERFAKNLGVIMGSSAVPATTTAVGSGEGEGKEVANGGAEVSTTAGRFKAIRAWVNENMEKHEGFAVKS